MTEQAKTIIVPVITKDAQQVFSNTMDYQSICSYFSTDEFAGYAVNADVNQDMLVSISEGMTNYLRNQSDDNQTLDWGVQSTAVCTNASVVGVKDSDDVKVMFVVDIKTNVEI